MKYVPGERKRGRDKGENGLGSEGKEEEEGWDSLEGEEKGERIKKGQTWVLRPDKGIRERKPCRETERKRATRKKLTQGGRTKRHRETQKKGDTLAE